MASSASRGDLTVWIQGQLTDQDLLVGIIDPPDSSGWNDDPEQPDRYFTPYLVLQPMNASAPTGSMGDPATEWNFPYTVTSVGVTPQQVEGQADKARRIINEIRRVYVSLGGENWRVFDARINAVGGVDKNRDARPPEFTQSDVVMVRVSKEQS